MHSRAPRPGETAGLQGCRAALTPSACCSVSVNTCAWAVLGGNGVKQDKKRASPSAQLSEGRLF